MIKNRIFHTIALCGWLIFTASSDFSQTAAPSRPARLTASLTGTITVQKLEGNNLGNFGCSNITVRAGAVGATNEWAARANAAGQISSGKCAYRIHGIPVGQQITATISGSFPKACDLKVFENNTSLFPTEVKSTKTLTFDWTVPRIACTLVK